MRYRLQSYDDEPYYPSPEEIEEEDNYECNQADEYYDNMMMQGW